MQVHSVECADGLTLHVREWGEPTAPPILFVHGWSQNHLCWHRQYDSGLAREFRLVGFDLRGHGMSEAPHEPEHYTQAHLWAGDIAAIITALKLDNPVLVGWSYGGLVVCDYLRAYGDEALAGVNLAGAAVTLNPSAFGTLIGSVFVDVATGGAADDLPTNIAAIRRLVHDLTAEPLPPEDHELALCWSMPVPAAVRGALTMREVDSDAALAAMSRPVLVSHGEQDRIVLPATGEHVLATCPTAVPAWYANTGHAPFLEAPERFNHELAAFARRCGAGSA